MKRIFLSVFFLAMIPFVGRAIELDRSPPFKIFSLKGNDAEELIDILAKTGLKTNDKNELNAYNVNVKLMSNGGLPNYDLSFSDKKESTHPNFSSGSGLSLVGFAVKLKMEVPKENGRVKNLNIYSIRCLTTEQPVTCSLLQKR